jgi:hypothetical protein
MALLVWLFELGWRFLNSRSMREINRWSSLWSILVLLAFHLLFLLRFLLFLALVLVFLTAFVAHGMTLS